jgi:hypothetical protein
MRSQSFHSPLAITLVELQQILGQCRHIKVTPTPGFDLRNYLVHRLRNAWPETARKVAAIDEKQFGTLCREIADHQAWKW